VRCSGSSALCIRWICFSPPYGMCMRTRHEGFESACRHAPQGESVLHCFVRHRGGGRGGGAASVEALLSCLVTRWRVVQSGARVE
jgi:hypothetical protein